MWIIGAVPMKNNGASNRNLIERNNSSWDEQKEIRDVTVGEVQGLGSSEETEFRINDVVGEVNNGSEGAIHVPAALQKPQPQGPVIHWERFLPIRSLKVLLVENDDCTRHVVSALLRNCSYEVTAVASGLQAWNILEDLTNHIDLVLTEVVVPSLSGFGLLCKIMSHKTFKNIPVIMMSSHDSMNVAFNCLSKGAVDFLVKPIRKNELKNLWQHVWRRCHSSSGSGKSSGSGSESGTQTKKYAKPKSNAESEKNTGSSDGPDNGSISLSIRDGSDNGSGTQSSWTKRAAEVESRQPTSQWDQLADAPDSTCAQVIHTKLETFSSRWVHVTETKECAEQDEQLDNVAMGKDLEIGISRDPDSQLEYQHKFSQPGSKSREKLSDLDSKQLKKEQLEIRSDNICGKLSDNAANLISSVGSCIYRAIDAPSGFSDTSQIKDKAGSDSRELPSLELTLDRLRGVDVGTSVHDNNNILRHSNLSAFSKYSTTFSANQASPGKVGSHSPLDKSSVTMKREKMHNSNCTPPNQQSNESTNNNDMASTTKCVPKPEAFDDKSESISAFKSLCSSGFQKVQYGHACAPKSVPGKAVDVSVSTEQVQARGNNRVQVQHCHHHHHHHHHHIHNIPHEPQSDHDDLSLEKMAATVPQCGSSNMLGEPIEDAAGNYSVNGSASGSNHGSNGQNRSSNAGATNIEIDNGVAGDSGVVGISGSGGNGADEDRHAQRAAALTKFRQKRKERCFEKKVRYQSRKRLAEQRPRVRGQFVRQIVSNDKVGKDGQDNIAREGNSPVDV
ncbi:two-component response regulator-like PRR37 [Cornus florida]|uniref:two-component response regulator-like PRR37 n=1 Tax=Cornus florida TaxID=4283 RepID=UPI00289BCC6C|nr:two-component response regulator-like PRR37 [Cornus florida]XP_059660662.1 two-component response regulator-like PRR37 [Cornus florida]